jgi:hypothetical protein
LYTRVTTRQLLLQQLLLRAISLFHNNNEMQEVDGKEEAKELQI